MERMKYIRMGQGFVDDYDFGFRDGWKDAKQIHRSTLDPQMQLEAYSTGYRAGYAQANEVMQNG